MASPTPTLRIPDDLTLDAARAGHVLSALGVEVPREIAARAAELLRRVVLVRSGEPTLWSVDGVTVFSPTPTTVTAPLGSATTYVPSCRADGATRCVHVAAVLLACAASVDPSSPLLRDPPWALAMAPLLRPEGGAAPPAPAPREGWIRYLLDEPPVGLAGGVTRIVSRALVLRRTSGEQTLKMPARIEEAADKVTGVTPLDREVHQLLTEAHLLLFGSSAARRDAKLHALGKARLDAALRALEEARDVWLFGEPVRVSATPVRPELVVEEGPDGTLHPRLSPLRARIVNLGEPWVLADGVVAPLDPAAPPEVAGLLGVSLPPVPPRDVARFLERVVVRSCLPVRLDAATGAVLELAPELRVLLSETHDTLEVATQVAYAPPTGDPILVDSGTGMAMVTRRKDGTVAVAQRDLEREQALHERAEELAGLTLPVVLRDDDAADFLQDRLPALRDEFSIWGERALATRVRGSVTPTVTVATEVDWFDLGVKFQADGIAVRQADVLRSWLAGRRWVRLPGGGVARLPVEWLARHGNTLTELDELRDSGRLSGYAAALVEQLLEDAEGQSQQAAERWRALARRIRTFEGIEERPVPETVRATLRDYQVRGFQWLAFLRDAGLGGCLADDMGLGKTLQTLALLADTHATPGAPSLVVAPTSVVHAWAAEARRFVPSLRVAVHHGAARGRDGFEDADLVITTYALLRRDLELFRATRWRTLVLDEAQNIKNPASEAARSARSLDAGQRLALTGTPLENNLFELYSLFRFVMPGFFGTQTAFARRYATPIHRSRDAKALGALKARIRPFILRRLKEEVASELPPLTEVVLRCELGPAQRRLYERVRNTYRETVLGTVEKMGIGGASLHVLEALTRLRQACCDPRLLPFEEAKRCTESAKLDLLMETVEEIREAGHRTLVFSQWTSLLALARERLLASRIDHLSLDGSTVDRQTLVERWNRPDGPPVFLISLKAGGTGLNLTGADHVIHLDPWWNPAAEAQATDRAHRIGQTRPVVAYRIVAADTVEERIVELQDRKRVLAEATLDEDRQLMETLTRADLEAVFATGAIGAGVKREEDAPLPVATHIPWTEDDEG